MTGHAATRTPPPRGVLRLAVLALSLAGFIAMHGLASAEGGALHCGSPDALFMTTDTHTTSHGPAARALDLDVGRHSVGADASGPSHDNDDLTIGCLLALLGTLVAIGLRLLGRLGANTARLSERPASAWLHAARAPPAPLFVSLCVFRL